MRTLSPALTPFTSAPTAATFPVMELPGPFAVSAELSKMPPAVVVSASSAMTNTRVPVGLRSFTSIFAARGTIAERRAGTPRGAWRRTVVERGWDRSGG